MFNNLLLLLVSLAGLTTPPTATKAVLPLQTIAARPVTGQMTQSAEGVVEAVRQTVMAAQVSGAIVELRVKAGDRVIEGQVLAKIDSRTANQAAMASQAQVQLARATLDVSKREVSRQRELFSSGFISQSALDHAEALFKSAQAQVNAQVAMANASHAQFDFYTLRAPYSGMISAVSVTQGDMATAGRPLLTLYDPGAMRVTATIPQSSKVEVATPEAIRVEVQAPTRTLVTPVSVTTLPAADPNTHTLQVRLGLPQTGMKLAPGTFAIVRFAGISAPDSTRIFVPSKAVLQRAELTGVYVVDAAGRAGLRQIRTGRVVDNDIEVLSGLDGNEMIAIDPQAAARSR